MEPRAAAAWTVLAAGAFAGHGALALAWWRASPRGFPAAHPQWWANEVAPWAVVATTLAGLALLATRRRAGARTALVALAGGWGGIALGLAATFPASGPAFALAPALLGALVLLLARAGREPSTRRGALVTGLAVAAAAAAGALLATTQRGADPDTRPRGGALPPPPPGERTLAPPDLAAAQVRLELPSLALTIEPLLRFVSCSPDRCWTLFAPGGPVRRPYELTGFATTGPTEQQAWFMREDGFDATRAHLSVRRDGGALELAATTSVTREVYAHLDTYTHVDAIAPAGATLALVFSPCPATPIEARPADYPVGRPMRFGYVDDQDVFRVVEATSGEKGPFRELARGVVRAEDALTITLLVDGAPACRLTWRDLLAQAGRALSPTAGWGVPVNAVEFRLEAPGRLSLWCTLAGTSVGRGFQSVGHAPGVYTNRLRVEPVR